MMTINYFTDFLAQFGCDLCHHKVLLQEFLEFDNILDQYLLPVSGFQPGIEERSKMKVFLRRKCLNNINFIGDLFNVDPMWMHNSIVGIDNMATDNDGVNFIIADELYDRNLFLNGAIAFGWYMLKNNNQFNNELYFKILYIFNVDLSFREVFYNDIVDPWLDNYERYELYSKGITVLESQDLFEELEQEMNYSKHKFAPSEGSVYSISSLGVPWHVEESEYGHSKKSKLSDFLEPNQDYDDEALEAMQLMFIERAVPQMKKKIFDEGILTPKATERDKKYNRIKTLMNLVEMNKKKRDRLVDKSRVEKQLYARPQMGVFDVGLDEDTSEVLVDGIAAINSFTRVMDKFSNKESLGEFSKNLSKFSEILENFPQDCIDTVTNEAINKLKAEMIQMSKDLKNGAIDKAKKLALVSLVCSTIVYYYMNPCKERLIGIGIGFGLLFMFTDIFKDNFLTKWIFHFFSNFKLVDEDLPKPQMMTTDDMEFCTSSITSLLTAYFSFNTGKNVPQELFKGLSNFGRVKMALKDIMMTLITVVEGVINWFRVNLFDSASMRFVESNKAEVNSYLEQVRTVLDSNDRGTFYINDDNYMLLESLIVIGKKFASKMGIDRSNHSFDKLLWRDINALEKLKMHFTKSHYTLQGSRPEAVGFCIAGAPGCGKSIAMEAFAYAMCAALLEEDKYEEFIKNPANFFHNRQYENVYWDGYNNQFITFMDDLGQTCDVAGNPDNEYMNVIRSVNGFTYTLHMANIEEKGNTVFNSRMLFVTTNRKRFDPKSIVEKEALDRRFAVRVICYPKDEYCLNPNTDYWNRKFDKSKLPITYITVDNELIPVSSFNPDLSLFIDVDGDGNPLGQPQSFDVICRRLIDEFKKRRDWRAYQKQYFEEVAAQYRSMYTAEPQMRLFSDFRDKDPLTDVDFMDEYNFCDDYELQNSFITRDDIIMQAIKEFPYNDANARKNVRTLCSLMFRNINPYNYNFVVVLMNVVHKSNISWVNAENFLLRTYAIVKYRPLMFGEEDFVLPSPKVKYTPAATYKDYFRNIYAAAKERDIAGILELSTAFIMQRAELLFFASVMVSAAVIKMMTWVGEAVFYCIKTVFNVTTRKKPEPHSVGFSDKLGHRVSAKHAKSKSKEIKEKIQAIRANPQMSGHVDSSGSELIKSMVHSNMYVFSVQPYDGADFRVAGQLFFVCDRIALLRYHYITTFAAYVEEDPSKAFAKVEICRKIKGREFRFEVTVADILEGHQVGELVHNDHVLVQFPKHVTVHTNRIKNFAVRSDYNKNSQNIPVMMPIMRKDCDVEYMLLNAHAEDHPLLVGDDKQEYYIREYYTYTAGTGDGDCGALMCVLNPRIPDRKIFGIHSAGHTVLGIGYSAAICQEDILDDLKMFGPIITPEEDRVIPNHNIEFYPGTFKVLGTVNPCPSTVGKSDIKKSRLHNTYFECLTAPAKLRPKFLDGKMVEGTDPKANAMSKFSKKIPYINADVLSEITHMYYADMKMKEIHPVEKRLLSWEECLEGVLEDLDSNRVNPKSSAGYPMNCKGVINLKTELFSCERGTPEWDKKWLEVKNACIAIENLYLQGIRPWWLSTDNVKDERRPWEKVRNALSRLFAGCPFLYLLIWKRYFGSFHIYFHKNRIYNGSAIGVNPFSLEWDFIAKELARVDITLSNIGAGDYASYDTSQGTQLHNCGLVVVNLWYGDIFSFVREILYLELTNSRHVSEGVVYELNYSLPSGHPFTPIINTIVGHIAMRWCWFRIVGVHQTFSVFVILIQCGDDHVFSVSPVYRDVFNEMTIVEKMAEIGLTYTTETKNIAEVPLRKLIEVEFLKRSFRWNNVSRRWDAPLRLVVVLEIPCWTKIRENPDDIVAQNVATTVRELSLHGKDVYDKWKTRILEEFYKRYPRVKLNQPLDLPYLMMQSIVTKSDAYFRG